MHCKPEERRNENKTFTKFYNLLIIHCEAYFTGIGSHITRQRERIWHVCFSYFLGAAQYQIVYFFFENFHRSRGRWKNQVLLIVTGYESVGLSWITVSSRRTTFGDW